jgi:nucleoside-diphosphate-sugar epimerase
MTADGDGVRTPDLVDYGAFNAGLIVDLAGGRMKMHADARAREMLGWKVLFTLDEGLRAKMAWYQEFFKPPA